MSKVREKWFEVDSDSPEGQAVRSIIDGPDFRGPADLRGITIGVDRRPAIVHKAGIATGSTIAEVDFSEGMFDGAILAQSEFFDCAFSRVAFKQVNLIGARFVRCSFSKAKIHAFMKGARFTDCDFSEATFTGARGAGGEGIVFENCDFTGAQLTRIEMRSAKFISCDFSTAVFKSCDLVGSEFFDSQPTPEQLEGSYL